MKYSSATAALIALILAAGCAKDSAVTGPVASETASLVRRTSLDREADREVAASGIVVYNAIPSQLPGNVPSQGFQCCSVSEVGDYVALAGTARTAQRATVLMSSWSLKSDYPSLNAAGYTHPITLNIYRVDSRGSVPALGSLIGSVTKTFLIPWRPAADPTCPGGTAWRASTGQCFNGFAFTIEFDLRALALTLPDKFIFGVAYNTNTWGYQPIGKPGPYESLNVGTANVNNVGVPPSVGSDVEPDVVFVNYSFAGFYTDGGTGGVGTFRRDTGWLGYAPAVRFNAFTVATSEKSCKDGGWKTVARTDARAFRNQGDCVSYVEKRKHEGERNDHENEHNDEH